MGAASIVWLRDQETDDEGSTTMTTTTDQRYTADTIATMSVDELAKHLECRLEQRQRAKDDMTRCHKQLQLLEDPDSKTYIDTMVFLGHYTREHAEQNRIIRQLQREQENRRLDNLGASDADARRPINELIDVAIAKYGMPCGVDEAGDTTLVAQMWFGATTSIECETDDPPSNAAVAARVADAYAVTYGYERVESRPDRATIDGASRDVDEITRYQLTAIDRSDADDVRRQAAALANALAATITNPLIRQHIAAEVLEQARTALGLPD